MEQFEPFQKVLVRNGDLDEWKIDLFSGIIDRKPYRYRCMAYTWGQCIPYEGNEHLLGTIDSPTPNREYKWGDIVECQHSNGKKWIKAIYIDYNETYKVHEVIWQGCKCIGHATHIRPLAEDSDALQE